jgi:hypothetical protein
MTRDEQQQQLEREEALMELSTAFFDPTHLAETADRSVVDSRRNGRDATSIQGMRNAVADQKVPVHVAAAADADGHHYLESEVTTEHSGG